jgi:hypothetical protein
MAGAATPTQPKTLKILRAEHASAQADAAKAIQREREAETQWRKYFNATRSDGVLSEDTTPFSRAEALIHIDAAKRELLTAQLDVARAQARVLETASMLRGGEDEEVEAELRALCPRLLKGLRAVQPDCDQLAELVQRHSALRNGDLQFIACQSSTTRWTSPLVEFERALKESGLIEADAGHDGRVAWPEWNLGCGRREAGAHRPASSASQDAIVAGRRRTRVLTVSPHARPTNISFLVRE